jgi:hypothetical protein
MKYLKKSAEVLIGKAGVRPRSDLSDYTATLVLPTHYSDGSGDNLLGIQVTREHLVQLRGEIHRYLSETTENKPEPESVELVNNFNLKSIELKMSEEEVDRILAKIKQPSKLQHLQNRNQQKQTHLVIDPKLMMVIQHKPTGQPDSWSAKIHILPGLNSIAEGGKLELSVLGNCEENARERLSIAFHDFIMTCLKPDSSESRIPDIVRENQQPVNSAKGTDIKLLEFDLNEVTSRETISKKTSEKWEARTVHWLNGCERELIAFGETEIKARTQLYKGLEGLEALLLANRSSDTNEPENSKQVNKADDKDSAPFKLNPNRAMSMKIGVDKWEARTKIFNGINDELVDLVATAGSEEVARKELDIKFSNFAIPTMNFIKFMSQDS